MIVALIALGAVGLLILVNATEPLLGYRWLFFFLVVLTFTGIGLPAAVLLNLRFPSNPAAGANVVVRQALWAGTYVATIAWLNVGRVYSNSLALMFLIGFIAIEVFLRLWEHSQWRQSR